MDTLSIALVGYGGIAEFHAHAMSGIEGVRLKTLVGRRAEPARDFAERTGFEGSTTGFDTAVADPEIDAIVIAAPNEYHCEMTCKALGAGKHVLCEIPLAMSHKGACDVVGKVNASGKRLMVAHTKRFDPARRFIHHYIGSGKAGQVYLHQCFDYWLRHENVGWTGYQRSWVDDVVFHHGCHVVDFALFAIGSPVRRVRGELTPLHKETGTSMDVSLLIRFSNEAVATLSLSYNSPLRAKRNLFLCDAGTLEKTGQKVTLNGDTIFESDADTQTNIIAQDAEFIQAVREDRKPECNELHALEALSVLQQVYDQMITLEDEEKYHRQWGL